MEHHLSQFVVQHLQAAISEIQEPLEQALRAEGRETAKPLDVIVMDIHKVAVYVASADDDISEKEAAILSDVCTALKGEKEGAFVLKIIMNGMREKVRNATRLPETVRLLAAFDASNKTRHADKAREMFFRFANAMMKADGVITDSEQAVLTEIKETLYRPAAIT